MASSELPEGAEVGIIALLPQGSPSKEWMSRAVAENGRRGSALEIIKGLKGHRLFSSPAEADAYLNSERDSWDY